MPTSTSALPGTIITNLPLATSIDGSEMVPIVQGGATKRGTTGQIAGSLTTNVTGAPYVLMSSSPTLTNARALTASSPITVTDGGAGTTVTIGLTTVPVNKGGTGVTTFSANQVVLGGSAATSPLQTVTAGTSGYLLVCSSATTAPSWVSPTAALASTVSFIMASSDSGLTGARKLSAQSGVTTITDGGGSSNITVGIAANGIGNTQIRQSAGLSVIGVTATASGNVADIAGTADQVLRVSSAGTSLGFGSINLGSSATTGITAGTSGFFLSYTSSTAAPTWQSGVLTGTVIPASAGGTGLSSYAVGDLITATSATAFGRLPDVSAGRPLLSGGVATSPAYSSTWLFFDDTNKFQRISKSSNSWSPGNPNTLLHLVGSSAGVEVSLEMQTFNTDAVYLGSRANGSPTAPTVVNSSDQICSIIATGWNGSSLAQGGVVGIFASETWSSAANGSEVRVYTISSGTTTFFNSARFLSAGGAYFTRQATFAPVAYPTTPLIQAVGANNGAAYIGLDAFGSSVGAVPYSIYRAARGVSSAFTPSQQGDPLGGFIAVGANANNTFTTPAIGNGGAAFVALTLENWSSVAQGAGMQFFTTPVGSIVQGLSAQMHGSGGITVGLSGVSNDPGTGNLATKNALIAGSTFATAAGGSSIPRLTFGTTGIGIYFGSGAPTITAVQGSLYLRTDGSATTNRLYVNLAGSSTWTAFTSSA